MTAPDLGFTHRWVPGSAEDGATLLLLHGTGGDEHDLLELGRALSPTASLLSPRGKVLEGGASRFFRRLAMGVFDEADLIARTHELADFTAAAATAYAFDPARVFAVGFSNGANIGGALLLLRPEALAGAALLRPMVPLTPPARPDLRGRRVLLAAGRTDPTVPPGDLERLAGMLRDAGADVSTHWADAGHHLAPSDVEAARDWLIEARRGYYPASSIAS